MENVITGYEAIEAKQNDYGVVLNKYADPTESELTDITVGEALDIADEDLSLVWCVL
jgi:hypothetical protein